VAELLLQRGANVNCRSKNHLTPMHLAAQEDQVPVAEVLVRHKSEIDPQTKVIMVFHCETVRVACHVDFICNGPGWRLCLFASCLMLVMFNVASFL